MTKHNDGPDEFDKIIQERDRGRLIEEIGSTDKLYVITGALSFEKDKAFIAAGIPKLNPEKGYVTENFLITSDKKKISINSDDLLTARVIVERYPSLIKRWDPKDIEDFLQASTRTDLQEIFFAIRSKSQLYLELPNEGMHTMIALWIMGTYFHRLFVSYPYVHLNGNAGSGKTKCLSLIATLGFNGELSVNNTPSYTIRIVHSNHATCCIDEVEKFSNPKDEETKTILAMLNAGYKRGTMIGKSEQGGRGSKWHPVRFEAYSPKVLAGINSLPQTLTSRCIPLIMVKSGNRELINREVDENDPDLLRIRNSLYRAYLEHHPEVIECYNHLQDEDIAGRSWELWKPLFSIALAISQSAYQEVRATALEIEQKKTDMESESATTPILLQGLLELIERSPEESFYTTEVIIDFLKSYDEEFHWMGDEKNKSRKGRWLGSELRRAGVLNGKMEQKKIDGKNTKGCTLNADAIKKALKNFGFTAIKEDGEAAADLSTGPSFTPEKEAITDLPF